MTRDEAVTILADEKSSPTAITLAKLYLEAFADGAKAVVGDFLSAEKNHKYWIDRLVQTYKDGDKIG
jgi:hypothetical protein